MRDGRSATKKVTVEAEGSRQDSRTLLMRSQIPGSRNSRSSRLSRITPPFLDEPS